MNMHSLGYSNSSQVENLKKCGNHFSQYKSGNSNRKNGKCVELKNIVGSSTEIEDKAMEI